MACIQNCVSSTSTPATNHRRSCHFTTQFHLSLRGTLLVAHGPWTFIGGYLLIALHKTPRELHAAIRFTSIATYLFLPSPRLWAKGHTPLVKPFSLHGHAAAAESHVFPFESFVTLNCRVLARPQSPCGKMNPHSAR